MHKKWLEASCYVMARSILQRWSLPWLDCVRFTKGRMLLPVLYFHKEFYHNISIVTVIVSCMCVQHSVLPWVSTSVYRQLLHVVHRCVSLTSRCVCCSACCSAVANGCEVVQQLLTGVCCVVRQVCMLCCQKDVHVVLHVQLLTGTCVVLSDRRVLCCPLGAYVVLFNRCAFCAVWQVCMFCCPTGVYVVLSDRCVCCAV